MDVKGIAELKKKLQGLPAELIQRMDRAAMKKGLRPSYDAVMKYVPVGETGNLANSVKITSKVVASGKSNYIYGMVEAIAPHAHLVEYGHEMCDHDGKPTGKTVPPHPFMLPALVETAPEVVNIIAEECGKGLEKCGVLT
jgi:HK97 gp10 family phage protein